MAYQRKSSSRGRTSYAGRGVRTKRKSYGTGARRGSGSRKYSGGQTVRVVVEHVGAPQQQSAPMNLKEGISPTSGRAKF